MKTPFVAHAPSILVVSANEPTVSVCREAAATMGIPLRALAEIEHAPDIVRDTRPLVIVCDESAGPEALSLLSQLATSIAAGLHRIAGPLDPHALAASLQDACVRTEQKRDAARG